MQFAWIMASTLLLAAGNVAAQQAGTPETLPVQEPPHSAIAGIDPAVDAPGPVIATMTPETDCCLVPDGTLVDIEVAESISSKVHKRGDRFAIRLLAPLMIEGQSLLPAGTLGVGEVVHASRSGGSGKAGELILAARYLEFEGQQIPLRGFRLGSTGKDHSGAVVATSATAANAAAIAGAGLGGIAGAGVLPMLIRGKQAEIPAGTLANAKFAADTHLPPTEVPATNSQE